MASAQDLWGSRLGPLAPGASAMGRQVKVFQCGAELKKWWVFNVLDDDGEHVCDLDLTAGEFEELLRFTNRSDDMKVAILHSASLWCKALFRLQAKVAAVCRVPTCSVHLVNMTKDQRLGVLKRLVDTKTMDIRLEPHTPNYIGRSYIPIVDTNDIKRALSHWSWGDAFWYPVASSSSDRPWMADWCLWKLSICFDRLTNYLLPATVIIEVRSCDPDPDTGESVVFETHTQAFARHDTRRESIEFRCYDKLEFGPFHLEDYMGFDKRNNNLGFSLRIQIIEELLDDGQAHGLIY